MKTHKTLFVVTGWLVMMSAAAAQSVGTPVAQPLYGPQAFAVDGLLYVYQGTNNDGTPQDQYFGPQTGQFIDIGPGGVLTGIDPATNQTLSGNYAGGVFSGNSSASILTVALADGVTGPNFGPPATLFINSQPWSFVGGTATSDYYTGPQGVAAGQILSVAQSGVVAYNDPYNRAVAGRQVVGSFANGAFSFPNFPGITVSTVQQLIPIWRQQRQTLSNLGSGTVSGSLDVVGNNLNVGSWSNSSSTAGLTVLYQDSPGASPPGAAVVMGTLRPATTWVWSQGNGAGATQMTIDPLNRLNLYNGVGNPPTIIDPSGTTSNIHMSNPTGDIPMLGN